MVIRPLAVFSVLVLIAGPADPAVAGGADVVGARADNTAGSWRFDVTVAHGDEGWEHYADAWRVKGTDGTVYGTRELLHPHVNEQPFTRALSGVVIPDGVETVLIEARDSVHGWTGEVLELDLPR